MIDLATVLGAVQDYALVGVLAIFVWLARKDYPYRAARWLSRKARGEFASPSRAHPAARAIPPEPFDLTHWEGRFAAPSASPVREVEQ